MKKRCAAGYRRAVLPCLVICAALLVVAWFVITGRQPSAPEEQSAIPSADFFVRECGQDIACGNALLYGCRQGSFTALARRQKIFIEVKGQEGARCLIAAAENYGELHPFVQEDDDADGDGMLTMNCRVPLGFSFEKLTAWLQGDGLAYCEGEYRNFTERLGSQLDV